MLSVEFSCLLKKAQERKLRYHAEIKKQPSYVNVQFLLEEMESDSAEIFRFWNSKLPLAFGLRCSLAQDVFHSQDVLQSQDSLPANQPFPSKVCEVLNRTLLQKKIWVLSTPKSGVNVSSSAISSAVLPGTFDCFLIPVPAEIVHFKETLFWTLCHPVLVRVKNTSCLLSITLAQIWIE